MILLWIGVVGFILLHWLKRLMPGLRTRVGRGPVAVGLIISLAVIVLGYRQAPFIPVYTPLEYTGYVNNILMIFAFYLMGVGGARAEMSRILRYPMLNGAAVWAMAHLLVNGDLASIILFGGMLIWAIVSQPLINMAEGAWDRPETRGWRIDASVMATAVVLVIVIGLIHLWLDRNPFLGTYG